MRSNEIKGKKNIKEHEGVIQNKTEKKKVKNKDKTILAVMSIFFEVFLHLKIILFNFVFEEYKLINRLSNSQKRALLILGNRN